MSLSEQLAALVAGSASASASNLARTTRSPPEVDSNGDRTPAVSSQQVLNVNILLTVIYLSIFVIGVVGNICNCLVIADKRNKYMKSATNYYLFSLSISDLLLLIFGLPHDLVNLWHPTPYLFGQFVCISRGWISEASTYASVLVIVAFTVERYLAICHPLRAHTMSRLSRSIKIIFLIWIIASTCALIVVNQYGVILIKERVFDNSSSSTGEGREIANLQCTMIERNESIFELSVLIFFIIPMAVITILYIKLGYHLRKKTRLLMAKSCCRSQQFGQLDRHSGGVDGANNDKNHRRSLRKEFKMRAKQRQHQSRARLAISGEQQLNSSSTAVEDEQLSSLPSVTVINQFDFTQESSTPAGSNSIIVSSLRAKSSEQPTNKKSVAFNCSLLRKLFPSAEQAAVTNGIAELNDNIEPDDKSRAQSERTPPLGCAEGCQVVTLELPLSDEHLISEPLAGAESAEGGPSSVANVLQIDSQRQPQPQPQPQSGRLILVDPGSAAGDPSALKPLRLNESAVAGLRTHPSSSQQPQPQPQQQPLQTSLMALGHETSLNNSVSGGGHKTSANNLASAASTPTPMTLKQQPIALQSTVNTANMQNVIKMLGKYLLRGGARSHS